MDEVSHWTLARRPYVHLWVLLLYCGAHRFISPLPAQVEEPPIQTLSSEDGLSHDTVWCIERDQTGFLWLGTANGLNRFDGYEFKSFYQRTNPTTISDNQIRCMTPTPDGRLWLGTRDGINLFDPETTQAVRHRLPQQLGNTLVYQILIQDDAHLWIASGWGLLLYNHPNRRVIKWYRAETHDLPSDQVRALVPRKDGNLWVGTLGGLSLLNPKTDRFTPVPVGRGRTDGLSHKAVRALLEDRAGYLWIGTDEGLNRMDGTRIQQFFTMESGGILAGDWINTLVEDGAGQIWVGTRSGGISCFDPAKMEAAFYRFSPLVNSLPSNNIVDIHPTDDGLVWIGAFKMGLAKLDTRPQKFRRFRVDQSGPNKSANVSTLCEDQTGAWWLGNQFGLIRYHKGDIQHFQADPKDPHALTTNNVTALQEGRPGEIWVGTYSGGLLRYNPRSQDFTRFFYSRQFTKDRGFVQALAKDRHGVVWIGTREGLHYYLPDKVRFEDFPVSADLSRGDIRVNAIEPGRDGTIWVGATGGLWRIGPSRIAYTHYRAAPGKEGSLGHNQVTSVLEDSLGRVWVGTPAGLNRLDPLRGVFFQYRHVLEPQYSWIQSMVEGQPGTLWLGTNAGLIQFRPPESVQIYDQFDGLPGRAFAAGAAFKNKDGLILMGGNKGFAAFQPREMPRNPHPPTTVVTRFKIMDRETPLAARRDEDGRLSLSYRENFFSFEFAALDFTSPEKNRYAYRLEGFDQQWTYLQNRRYASYTNLDGGNYVFRVKASNNDGVWNDKAIAIPITITPPLWKQAWFQVWCTVLFLLLVYTLHRYRMRGIRREGIYLQTLAEERTEALRSTHQRLGEQARKAGKAEITTGVLHNTGNLLNSVSVSVTRLREILDETKIDKLQRINLMLADHKGELAPFLAHDERGKLVPKFFAKVVNSFQTENRKITYETTSLLERIELMTRAVSLEQTYAARYQKQEKVQLSELVDHALMIDESALKNRQITVTRDFKDTPSCQIEAFELVNVLTNLIKNAADALVAAPPEEGGRRIHITIRQKDEDHNRISVRDNGLGISAENLEQLFSFGFSTKKHGHGFGLHSCKVTMVELGGDITADSPGKGKGATFHITVPLESKKRLITLGN